MTVHPQYCYTHTDHVYATDHRIELKNNILMHTCFLQLRQKSYSYWSSLVHGILTYHDHATN